MEVYVPFAQKGWLEGEHDRMKNINSSDYYESSEVWD